MYLGPPGLADRTALAGTYSHVYLFSEDGASGVTVVDADTQGSLFSSTVDIPPGGMIDVLVDSADYDRMNDLGAGFRPYVKVSSPSPIAVLMANWNDNWMSYATAVVVRNPEVRLSGPKEIVLGSSYVFSGALESRMRWATAPPSSSST